jgi:hypothetical protein
VDRDRRVEAGGDASDRALQTEVRECGRVHAVCELTQFVEGELEILLCDLEHRPRLTSDLGLLRSAAQVHPQRDQPLLCAVVQVSLDSLPRRVGRVQELGPRCSQALGVLLALGHERDEVERRDGADGNEELCVEQGLRARGELDRRPVVRRVPNDERGRFRHCERGSPPAESQRTPDQPG